MRYTILGECGVARAEDDYYGRHSYSSPDKPITDTCDNYAATVNYFFGSIEGARADSVLKWKHVSRRET